MSFPESSKTENSVKYDDKTGMFTFGFATGTLSSKDTSQSVGTSQDDSKSLKEQSYETESIEAINDERIEEKIIENSSKLEGSKEACTVEESNTKQNSAEKMDVSQNSVEIITPNNHENSQTNQTEVEKALMSPENKRRKLNDGQEEGSKDDSKNQSCELSHSKISKNSNKHLNKNVENDKDIPVIYISSDSEPNKEEKLVGNSSKGYNMAMLNAQRVESEMYRCMGEGAVGNSWLVNYRKGDQEIVYLSDDTDTEEDVYEEQVNNFIDSFSFID